MTSQTPRVTIAKPARANSGNPAPVSAGQRGPRQQPDSHAPRAFSAPSTRLKLVIRRLPPGLTQAEFEEVLGEDWKIGGDKVDWGNYKPGKISADPAKPSKPSRAYFHVKSKDHPTQLGDKVRSAGFNDAKGSGKDPCLLGPPSVEYCTYARIPNARSRKDARQSTIDQDPEFIDFLESLTNPIAKSSTVDQEIESTKTVEKVTTTPLIQFLKDKKANKSKEGSSNAKNAKHGRQDSKEAKGASNSSKKTPPVVVTSSKKRSTQAAKVEQAARDAVKVLNKQATGGKGSAPTTPVSPAAKATISNVTPSSSTNAALAEKKRERGSASAAAKILQRDLGLGGSPGGRGRGSRGGNAGRPVTGIQASAKSSQTSSQETPTAGQATATETTSGAAGSPVEPKRTPTLLQKLATPPTGPAAAREGTNTPLNATKPQPKSTPPSSTSTQAFLKHANPSQGITEPLLEEAFSTFGAIKNVEIDKKKGFAYVGFEAAESLQEAIKASPIKVAQGQVVVLERKSGPTLQARNVRGGGGGGSPMMSNRSGAGPGMNARGGNARGGRGGMGRGGSQILQSNKAKATPATSTGAGAPAAQQGPENATPSSAPLST